MQGMRHINTAVRYVSLSVISAFRKRRPADIKNLEGLAKTQAVANTGGTFIRIQLPASLQPVKFFFGNRVPVFAATSG